MSKTTTKISTSEFLVNIRIEGEIVVRVSSDSLSDAIQQAGTIDFSDLLSNRVEDVIDSERLVITGLFKDQV